tara:strand:+ start:5109 stop:5366 length:258 start_codon:yes stop_codon:yes gene_type:complete
MRKTKEQLVNELNELQKSFIDQRESLGQIIARQQQGLNELKEYSVNLESYIHIYEKTILVLSGRLVDATKGFNSLPNVDDLSDTP